MQVQVATSPRIATAQYCTPSDLINKSFPSQQK